MSERAQVAIVVQRIGPHHHARYEALACVGAFTVAVIEVRASPDAINMWKTEVGSGQYVRMQASGTGKLGLILDALRPAVIVCTGYSDTEIHAAMLWAFHHGVRLVTCADSTVFDQPRVWVRETLKRVIVAGFDAGLVAGERSHRYLESLGLDAGRRFSPWDVVDNRHFENGADDARSDADGVRLRVELPPVFFLFVGRFIWEKNLPRLIDAYARYRAVTGEDSWPLLLSGAGPLEEDLRKRVCAAGLAPFVRYLGFTEYRQLPLYYGLAGALIISSVSETWGLVVNEAMASGLPVLVSSRCGCAPDLVRDGENGYVFEPDNVGQIAEKMRLMTRLEPEPRRAMGKRSREIIAAYSPEAFARGLTAAINRALAGPPRRVNWLTRQTVRFLARRSK
jgi:glycosyltransferase involved in cell wall biosynthesis